MIKIARNSNQALELANFAFLFMKEANPDPEVINKTKLWNLDLVLLGLDSFKLQNSLPNQFLKEAVLYNSSMGAYLMEADQMVSVEKAVRVNCAAYADPYSFEKSPDIPLYFPVVIAAAQQMNMSGPELVKSMILIEEIRYKISQAINYDPFINDMISGGIACVVTYGTLMGASPSQIEKAQGMLISLLPLKELKTVIPSYHIAEVSILCVIRSMLGNNGPEDVFRKSFLAELPFDLEFSVTGTDFYMNNLSYRLGIYDNLYGTAIQALFTVIRRDVAIIDMFDSIESIEISVSDTVFQMVSESSKNNESDPLKSLKFIISILFDRCLDNKDKIKAYKSIEQIWKLNMLFFSDYDPNSLTKQRIKKIMNLITFTKGENYEKNNLNAASIKIKTNSRKFETNIIEKPRGHRDCLGPIVVNDMLYYKFLVIGNSLLEGKGKRYLKDLNNLEKLTHEEIVLIYSYKRFLY